MTTDQDRIFMQLALDEAQKAFAEEEVPVGAVVVCDGKPIAWGRNQKERLHDPRAHAEMLAIGQAAASLERWRLLGCSVYVTLEPCPMCLGAMLSARIDRLVFGCPDPKAGAAGSLFNLSDDPRLNHRIEVESGVMADEAAQLLRDFFAQRRRRR